MRWLAFIVTSSALGQGPAAIEFGPALTESPVVRFVNDGSVLRVWIGESSTVEVRFAVPQSRP